LLPRYETSRRIRIDWKAMKVPRASVEELQNRFAIPGVLAFEETSSGLVVARVTAPSADATIYLQGAHLTHWKPASEAPAIFLSQRAEFAPGKPIRGGVPIVFPWFGERQSGQQQDGKSSPQHGFARISEWTLAFAAMAGDEVHLTFTLVPNELSRSLGFDRFKLAYNITIGRALTLELTVLNDSGSGGAPFALEEALHTYLAVADARQVSIDGLAGTTYIDKVDGLKQKVQAESALLLEGRTDRPYFDTDATCVLHDPAGGRRIVVSKNGSNSTVVWNPWQELTAKMPDMEPDAWLHMTCIETANVGTNAITLQAGETHTMRAHYSIEKTG
jgi:glucose-6-phosphate 1-epimerase